MIINKQESEALNITRFVMSIFIVFFTLIHRCKYMIIGKTFLCIEGLHVFLIANW